MIHLARFRLACIEMIVPRFPASISSLARAYTVSNLQICPTMKAVPAFSAAAMILSQSSMLSAMGFSRNTCFPAARASTVGATCSLMWVTTVTMSMLLSASICL